MSHSLSQRYLKKLTSNVIGLISGFVVTSLAPRALGPLDFGKFSFVTDIFAQMFIFLEGGSSNALYNKVSQNHQSVFLLRKYLKFLLLANLLVFGGLLGSLYAGASDLLFSNLETRYIFMGLIYSSLFWLNSIYTKVLDGLGATIKMEQHRIYIAVFRALGVASLFFIHQVTLVNFFILQIFAVLILNFSFLRLIHQCSKLYKPTSTEDVWKYFYQYSSPLFVYGAIGALATIADRWLLQHFSGLTQQGYFSLATQLGAICFLFSSSLTPLFHREIAIAKHQNNIERIQDLIYQSFPVLFFVAATLGIFSSINAPDIIRLIGGAKYQDQMIAYSLMFLYPIHQTYGQLVGSIYYASGDTKLYRNIGTLLIILGMLTSFFLLAPSSFFGLNLGFTGMAIKNVALQLFNVHVLLYFSFKKIKISLRPFVFNQIYVLASLGCIALLAKTLSQLIASQNVLLGLMVNGLFYFLLMGVTLRFCYKNGLPILMRDTQKNIGFILNKIDSLRSYLK